MKFRLNNSVFMRGGVAALDQGMLSALNFSVQIILIKSVPKFEFGYYSIAFAIILYLVSIQNALVNTPITVLLAGKKNEEREKYISSVYSGHYLILLPIVVVILFISLIYYFGFSKSLESILISSLTAASFGVLLREFLRGYFYSLEQPLKVLNLDFNYTLLYLGFIGITLLLGELSVPLVIFYMGLAAAFDSLVLSKRIKISLSWQKIKPAFVENWQMGKWSLIGVTTTHIQSYSYLYLIGVLLGSTAMAEVSASRILLVPFTIAMAGWGNVIRPHGSKLREENKLNKFLKQLILASFAILIILFCGAFLVSVFSVSLTHILFTKEYKDVFDYIFLWAAIFSAGFIRTNASYGLQVIKKFKSLAMVNIITLIITLILSYSLISIFGISGALIASLVGEIIFGLILWFLLFEEVLGKGILLNKFSSYIQKLLLNLFSKNK